MTLTIRTSILVLMVLLCGSATAQTQPQTQPTPPKDDASKWKQFSSAEGGFTVSFPGTPKADVTELESNMGKLKTHLFTVEADDMVFFISFADVLVSPKTPQQRDTALNQIRDHAIARHRLLSEKRITFDGIVGRELLVRREIGLIQRGRYFYAKRRLYYVIVTAPPMVAFGNAEPSANAADLTEIFETSSKRFFNSFKLTK